MVEVLGATVILSGTILGFVRIMADNLAVSRDAEHRLDAILLAEHEVESIKNTLYGDFTANISPGSTDLGRGYRARRSVTLVDTYIKHIQVEVGFDTNDNKTLGRDEVLLTLDTCYADHR